ncbi:MAG: alpha/beta hydrolase [Tannerellaceae bacterium]|jgi:pimeloyl-ACP methyl ester carboxylesterase|nr:alpha/beta hydrolase [Tannerellaceae bacterium]
MKAFYTGIVLLFVCAFNVSAQDITGKWYGNVDMGGMKLRIIFSIAQSGEGYTGFLLSPDQSSQEIPADIITWKDNQLTMTITQLAFSYKGTLKEDETLEGAISQMGATFPAILSRKPFEVNRPQEPRPPYPYKEEEVTFQNSGAGIKLSGTLTLPNGNGTFPAVILVTGSGSQNRDEEMMGHKPFLVIADYLTRRGIAVLRYDDRGVGRSEGDFEKAFISDFADDAAAAIAFLKSRKEIDPKKTGAIGHSEGGAVVTLLAAKQIPSFIITLAGVGVAGREVLRSQREAIFKASGAQQNYIDSYNATMAKAEDMLLAASNFDQADMEQQLKTLFAQTPLAGQEKTVLKQLSMPVFRSLLLFDPAVCFKEIRCPVLALNGAKDLQVVPSLNLEGFRKITTNGNKQVTVREYPGLNHLFQTTATGLPTEYNQLEETFSPTVMKDISEWILRTSE